MRLVILFLILVIGVCALAQPQPELTDPTDDNSNKIDELIRVSGHLDHSLPYILEYDKVTCKGKIYYGDDQNGIELEGECKDNKLLMYEFDSHSRVSGTIEGSVVDNSYFIQWINFDRSLVYDMLGSTLNSEEGSIRIYDKLDDYGYAQFFLWNDKNRLANSSDENNELKWIPFKCTHATYACHYYSENNDMINLSLSDRKVSVGSRLFDLVGQIEVNNIKKVKEAYFYNFSTPVIGDIKFDNYIYASVKQYLDRLAFLDYSYDEELFRESRFQNRANGDVYFSTFTSELVSGYLSLYSSEFPKVTTVPFTYDRTKKEFIDIRKVWERDFNFSFFLSNLINEESRKLLNKEDAYTRSLMSDITFSHINFSPRGLVIFSDYNLLYGRRKIQVPFTDIAPFIKNKAIKKLISMTKA